MKCLVSLLLSVFLYSDIQSQSEYIITATDLQKVSVSGSFVLNSDTIFIFQRGVTKELPEGEKDFVRALEVKYNGGSVQYKYIGEGNWLLEGLKKGDRVSIFYEILATHDEYNWDHVGGVDESAFTNDDGLFFTGYTLFIVPGMEEDNIKVKFQIPGNWKASTPWKKLEENTFKPENTRFLLNNCMMIGRHNEQLFNINGMEVRLALSNRLVYARGLLQKTMTKLFSSFREYFGGIPAPAYLVVMSEERMTDGSAFRRSFCQIIKDSIDEKGVATWGYIMAHEICHLWNGQYIQPSRQEEWFKEGFTDYITCIVMRKSGLIGDDILFRKFEHMIRRYWLDRFWQRDTLSIRETGSRKNEFRFGVYGGGAIAALALEVEMRKATGNRKGIKHLMQEMYTNYGSAKRQFSMDDIIQSVSKITGKDMTVFFQTNINTPTYIEMTPYLSQLGLDLHTVIEEVYVSRKPGFPGNEMYTAIVKEK